MAGRDICTKDIPRIRGGWAIQDVFYVSTGWHLCACIVQVTSTMCSELIQLCINNIVTQHIIFVLSIFQSCIIVILRCATGYVFMEVVYNPA